jgi:uncharacterized protein
MISTQKVILVHGYKTTPNGAWFPWLMGEVKKLAVFAAALDMPTPETPTQAEWVGEIARAVDRHTGSDVYLVGHSLGVAAILDYLQSPHAKPVRGAVLVAGRVRPSQNLATAGFYQNFDFAKIKSMSGGFVVIHATDDDMVPYDDGVILAEALGVELVTLQTGKHLTGSQGVFALLPVLDGLIKLGLTSERNSEDVY